MSRVNRLAHKLVTYRTSFRREAIDQDIASQALGKFDYKIPFSNLFGKGVYRTVVPLKSPMQKQIEDDLGELKDPSGAKFFDGVDWVKGEAYKVVPPHEKAPPGTPPKVQRTNLGKVLARLPNAKNYLNWWSQNQGVKDENGYSVVISRHPLDVIRMSDFPGGEDYPEIGSCHSPGGVYWESCVSEMKHGGPIAYLVKNKDLWSLDPKQVAGRGEIFADPDREIPGIQPLSRLRLRRYTHNDDAFDLAIPETRVYGNQSSDFKAQVMDWARTTQAGLIGGHRWRMDEFTRRGGDYSDSADSALFNRLFDDQQDHGNTDKGGAGKGQAAENDRRRIEIAEIHRNWERLLGYCSVSYEEYEGEDDDVEVQFSWSGSMSVGIPVDLFVDGLFDVSDHELNSGPGSLKGALRGSSFYAEDVHENSYTEEVSISFYINHDDENRDPDGYNDFCSTISDDYDDKYDQIKSVITNWLYENEHLNPSPARQFMTDFESNIHQLKNFEVEWGEEGLEALAEVDIGSSDAFYVGGNKGEFAKTVELEIRKLVENEIKKIIASQKSTSGYLPGFEPEPPKREIYNLYRFNVFVYSKFGGKIIMKIQFVVTDLTTQEEMSETIDLLKIVDRMLPRIAQECVVWLQRYTRQISKYEQERQEYTSKYHIGSGLRPFEFDPRQARRRRRSTTQEIFAP